MATALALIRPLAEQCRRPRYPAQFDRDAKGTDAAVRDRLEPVMAALTLEPVEDVVARRSLHSSVRRAELVGHLSRDRWRLREDKARSDQGATGAQNGNKKSGPKVDDNHNAFYARVRVRREASAITQFFSLPPALSLIELGDIRHFCFWGNRTLGRHCRMTESDPLLPFAAQGLCVAQLGLGTVFRRARLML